MPILSSRRSLVRRVVPATLTVAVALAVTATAAGAVPSHHRSSPLMRVAQGAGSARLAGAKPTGTPADDTLINVSVILRSPNLATLESKVAKGWTGNYLTTSQFATAYGQPQKVISAINYYLNSYGIKTSTYADHLDISAVGTIEQIDAAFHVTEQSYWVKQSSPDLRGHAKRRTVYGPNTDPTMPPDVAKYVLAVLGLSNYAPMSSQALRTIHNPQSSAVQAAAGSGIPVGDGLAPQDFEDMYNLTPLENQGSQGQGRTIGITSLAGIDPSVPLAFWNNVLGLNVPSNKLTVINIDGGPGAPDLNAGSSETDLDVEQSGAIAPKANIRLYLAPNSDAGFADAFFAEASDNIADTTSTSWGESDTIIQAAIASAEEPAEYAQVFDEVFAEMGAQGQSSFDATGDFGAYQAIGDAGTTNLSTGADSDSPYTTATGGTTLPGVQTYHVRDSAGNVLGTESINIPHEIAWGWDYLWPIYKILGEPDEATAATDGDFIEGSNGGYSTIEPRPSYQKRVGTYNYRPFLSSNDPVEIAPGVTEPTTFGFNPTPVLSKGEQDQGRAIPDLSTDGDPQTGYAVYDPALFGGDGFAEYGGTSFVAPQLNGANAVIDSALGHRTGLWNPVIYAAAYGAHSPFTPINETTVYKGKTYLYQTDNSGKTTVLPGEFTNTNLYYTGRAATHWNPATGLGIPNLAAMASFFH